MKDKQRRTLRTFMSAFTAAVQRRHFWNVLPWDPASVLLLYNQHAATYKQLLVYYRRHRLHLTPEGLLPPATTGEGATGEGAPGLLPGRTLLQDLLCAAIHSRAAYGCVAVMLRGYCCMDARKRVVIVVAGMQHVKHCFVRYAMAAGHVRSLTSFLLMKTMTHIHFDAAGGVSAEANNEAVAAMAGIQVGCLPACKWNTRRAFDFA